MKTEQRALIFSAFINMIVALIKIIGGVILGFGTLIADGFYTVSDFITDILAIAGAKIGKKRANKRYPLGYGNFEYIIQMIMGFVILLVGIVVIVMSFNMYYETPSFLVILVALVVMGLKIYSSNLLLMVGKKINSSMLINSSKESFIDVLSSGMILVIVVIGQFFKDADKIGSIIIGIMILGQAFKIIYQNAIALIGESSNDNKINDQIARIFSHYKKINYKSSTLIKHGSYYHLILNISINKDYTIPSLIKAEYNIKKQIKSKNLGIKFIDFDITQGT